MQELIRNRCVNRRNPRFRSGDPFRADAESFFAAYGIAAEILESSPGRASVIARVPGGEAGEPALAYMSHLDVVPANDEDWTANPFGGELRGGYVWGRGALDMLSTTAAQAVAFAELARVHGRFSGDLVFLAVADEEASGRLGARCLVENHWDRVRADYMITELGGFFTSGGSASGGGTGVTVTVGEKGIAWPRLKARGMAGHGSMPWRAGTPPPKSDGRSPGCRITGRASLSREYEAMVRGLVSSRGA